MVLWTGGISPRRAGLRHLSSGRGLLVLLPAAAAAASQPSKKFKKTAKIEQRSRSHTDSTAAGLLLIQTKYEQHSFPGGDRTMSRSTRLHGSPSIPLHTVDYKADRRPRYSGHRLTITDVRGTVRLHIMDRTTFNRSGRGGAEHNNSVFTAARQNNS